MSSNRDVLQRTCSSGSMLVILIGLAVAVYSTSIDLTLPQVSTRIDSCSRDDESNGSLCECGAALDLKCHTLRHIDTDKCLSCADSVAANCTMELRNDFCHKCSSQFDFRWVHDLSTRNGIPVDDSDLKYICLKPHSNASSPSDRSQVLALEGNMLQLLQLVGCNELSTAAYATAKGYNVTHDNHTFLNPRGDVLGFVIDCCKNYKHEGGCDASTDFFWLLLGKLSGGCQISKIESELEEIGVAFDDINDTSPFPSMYALDVPSFPKTLVEGFSPFLLSDLFGNSVRYLVGMMFAAVEKHNCGHSWFVPGADKLFANVFRLQAHFYFPPTVWNPKDPPGTCGSSSESKSTRLKVCDLLGTYMFDTAQVSGMSIMSCFVDCLPSKLQHVDGTFVSVSLVIIEIAKSTDGYDTHHGGIQATVNALTLRGVNVTTNAGVTVGFGFNYSVNKILSDNIFTDIDWKNGIGTQTSKKFTFAQVRPNLTEAMLLYRAPPSSSSSRISSTVIIVVVAASMLVVGIVVGFFLRARAHANPQFDGRTTTVVANTVVNRNQYEESVNDDVLIDDSDTEQQSPAGYIT
eukprot:m.85720 g.85720  ORF g.85720 m.85720 type:complete len:576 (-) comp25893_c1_seq1:41-1768(-)